MVESAITKTNFINRKLLQYVILTLVIVIGIGEGIARFVFSAYAVSPLALIGFSPATQQYFRLLDYTRTNTEVDCIFYGSSLVQTGINPKVFEEEFFSVTGTQLNCFNAGMDSATLSSIAPTALLFSQVSRPKYVIVGVQVREFIVRERDTPGHTAEDIFNDDGWLNFKLGSPNPLGWLKENSHLYRSILNIFPNLFPKVAETDTAPLIAARLRPEVPRVIADNGYGPLSGFRDASPLFYDSIIEDPISGVKLDIADMNALELLINHARQQEFELILVEMPVNESSAISREVLGQIRDFTRKEGIPFLATGQITPLPPTAFSDQIHLHISGSTIFSQWLGTHLGQAVANNKLDDISDPIWDPILPSWDDSLVTTTLGLSSERQIDFANFRRDYKLLSGSEIVFNPSEWFLDRDLLQALLGYTVDWQDGISDTDRVATFELMVVLDKMQYEAELDLASEENLAIQRWRETLDPDLLKHIGIDLILCRLEKVDLNIAHCPSAIIDHPSYTLVGSWDFDPLYEQYSLYRRID